MQILRLDPPPAAQWTVRPATRHRRTPGAARRAAHRPRIPLARPRGRPSHQDRLRVSAASGDRQGCICPTPLDILRSCPFAVSIGLPRPTPEIAAEEAVFLLAGLCGERPDAARPHPILLSAVATQAIPHPDRTA